MQAVPANFGNAIDSRSEDAHSSSSSSARSTKPVVRTASPQQSLLQAVFEGDTNAAKRLLAAGGIDVNAIDPVSWLTPLMLAAREGHEDVAVMLLRAKPGAEVDRRNNRGDSALSLAAAGGKTDVVELLLDRKADIELSSPGGRSALVEAAAGGHVETVKLLLARGARVNGGESGEVPLVVARRHGNRAMAALLLENKASVQDVTHAGPTPAGPATGSMPEQIGSGPEKNMLVRMLAGQVVEGTLSRVGQQSDETMKALAALLASPQCKVEKLVLVGAAIDAGGAASL